MAASSTNDSIERLDDKARARYADVERQPAVESDEPDKVAPKSLGSGTALAIGVFATTLTTLSLSLMEWRGVKTNNVFVANFFFAAAFGLVVTAQWELSVGNGFAYTVFSAFVWTVFAVVFLVASLPTNLVYIGIFFTVVFGFLLVASSYFALADGNIAASEALKKGGGGFCFVSGLIGWYLTFHLLLKDSIVELPLGDTSRYFAKSKQA
ncbi:membrane protein [Ascochyta rabiei]|uniref:Membrane protein n=1 Tax=Didymella rabiei TaxID=5454 RepID=A0A163DKG4_DIDRA|nr:membrane protein [Ascochyta rabiei]